MKNVWTAVLVLCTSALSAQINFSNVASNENINHKYETGIVGGGVSFCDFNGDGFDDITLATPNGETIKFYKNLNGNIFQNLSPLVDHNEEAKQILWVDYDNDGDKDLFVATFDGINRFYKNKGDMEMEDITEWAGLPLEGKRTFGACFGDFNRDGWVDLYYGQRDTVDTAPNINRLFKNNADGTFTEVTQESGAEDPGRIPFCSAFLDYNNDKWPDIYTANDKGSINTLLKNNGDGTFSDVGETTNSNIEMDAMSTAIGDIDNDGWSDIYITNTEEGSVLLRNLGEENGFEDVADANGTGFYGIGWGSNFFDADNDGDQDLYVSGMIAGSDAISSAFYENDGTGLYDEPDAGFEGDTVISFNNAIGDFNNDGLMDIMVINYADFKSQLWRNNTVTDNHFLKVRLQGVLSNRDAIGARVEVTANGITQSIYTHCGIGFLGQNSEIITLGLGQATEAESITITWPTGHIDQLSNIAADQTILVVEGSTTNDIINVDDDVDIVEGMIDNTREVMIESFEVYPNPAQDDLRWDNVAFEPQTAWIYNHLGQLVATPLIQQQSIAIQQLPTGIYTLLMASKKGDFYQARFSKF